MSGLLFLTSEDFEVNKGTKGNILCNSIQGFSLILFYSTQCEHCQNLIPIFKQLPGSIGGCQFGMINVSHNKKCIILSRDTISPITVVPYIILYMNGRPYMRYQGPHDKNEIIKFIVEVSKNLQAKQHFVNDPNIKEKPRGKIAECSTGQPLCGDDKVCYLEFDDAYSKLTVSSKPSRPRAQLPQAAGMVSH